MFNIFDRLTDEEKKIFAFLENNIPLVVAFFKKRKWCLKKFGAWSNDICFNDMLVFFFEKDGVSRKLMVTLSGCQEKKQIELGVSDFVENDRNVKRINMIFYNKDALRVLGICFSSIERVLKED